MVMHAKRSSVARYMYRHAQVRITSDSCAMVINLNFAPSQSTLCHILGRQGNLLCYVLECSGALQQSHC